MYRPIFVSSQMKPAIETLMKYKPDPLKVDEKKDKCAVELADERGPAFTALTVMLFHQGCEMHNHNRQMMLKFLAQRKHIGDHTVSVNYYYYYYKKELLIEYY